MLFLKLTAIVLVFVAKDPLNRYPKHSENAAYLSYVVPPIQGYLDDLNKISSDCLILHPSKSKYNL